MFNFEKFKNEWESRKILYEKAMFKDKVSKIDDLIEIGDYKESMKLINQMIKSLKDDIKNMDWLELEIKKIKYYESDKFMIDITLPKEKNVKLQTIKENIKKLDKEYQDKIFKNGYKDFSWAFEIDPNNLNEIHMLDGIPDFLKNLGLGKMFLKRIVKDIDFIYINSQGTLTNDMKMVVHSLLTDHELYSFSYYGNILHTRKDINIEFIKDFFKNKDKENCQVDDDFLHDNNIKEENLFVS